MAQIEKLLIDAATKAGFQEQLEAGNIPDYAIVFISDSKEIYTKGKYYPCPYTKEELDNKFSECNSNIQDTIDSLLGQANGIASLDSSGKVPSSQLPSYVDDVLEYNNRSGFPGTGEAGKIYIAKDTNLTYRWSGSTYIEISQSLALGETSSTAYAGNKGKQNANNIASLQTKTTNIDNYTVNGKKISTNPTINKGDVGLGNVNNTSDANKPISTATQNALNQKQNTLVSGTNIKTLNGWSLLGSGNLTADGPITIQKMNLMTVSQYNSIVGSLANNTYKSYLCADAAGNVKGGTVTLDTEFGKLIHSDDAMAVNLGDIMLIGKTNNTGFVKILPLNDAKTKTDSFPGTYGLMVPNDKEKLDKCVTDIDQTCFRCYTGTFNTNNCLWYGYYMYCNLGRPAGAADGETYLLRVANAGVENGAMLIHQTAWSALDPSKCFYRIIKTTDRNVYEPPTTTYGEWQEGTGEGPSYTLPTASSSTKGGITLGYTENGKNYPVELDSSGKAFVNVPWTDTKVTVDSSLSSSSTNPVQNKVINSALSGKANTSHTHTISQISDLQTNWDTFLKANPTLISNAISLTDEDLNDYNAVSDCGYYYSGGGNSVLNTPSGIASFGMVVLRSARGVVQQLLYGQTSNDDNNPHLFIRRYYNTWTSWDEIILKSDLTWNNISGKPGSFYTLPTASASTLGGVKVGAGLRITNGVLSATGGGTADSVDWSNIDNKPSSFPPSTHTHNAFTGATSSTAGSTGFVPAPASGNQNKYLRGDGTWQTPPDTNTTYSNATTSTAGLMSASDKSKLNGIANNANNYVHPTTAGNKHIPSGGSSGQILRWSASGTAAWGNDNNTTYSIATASTAGLVKPASVITKPTINSASTTSGKYYHVQMSSDGNMFVNVPWTNTTYSLASTSNNGLLRQLPSGRGDGYFLNGDGNWAQLVANYINVTEVNGTNLTVSSFDMNNIQNSKIFILLLSESATTNWGSFNITDGDTSITLGTGELAATIGNGYYLCVKTYNGSYYLIGASFANTTISNSWTAYQDFTSGAGNSGSDMRFKSEVENVNSTLDDINKINVIKYIWEHPDEKDVKYTFGVNADDLINLGGIYATMVHHRQDKYDTKWVEYDRFGVLAIKGLQEINQKLEQKCSELEQKCEKYESALKKIEDKLGIKLIEE